MYVLQVGRLVHGHVEWVVQCQNVSVNSKLLEPQFHQQESRAHGKNAAWFQTPYLHCATALAQALGSECQPMHRSYRRRLQLTSGHSEDEQPQTHPPSHAEQAYKVLSFTEHTSPGGRPCRLLLQEQAQYMENNPGHMCAMNALLYSSPRSNNPRLLIIVS